MSKLHQKLPADQQYRFKHQLQHKPAQELSPKQPMRAQTENNVELELISPCGPAVAYHVGCVVGGMLYIHGGIDRARSTEPLNGLHRYNSATEIWEKCSADGSPRRSHHAAVVLQDRYLVLIGGWTGKCRTGDVSVYDSIDNVWFHPRAVGFPAGAGLSSHTASLLGNGRILVICREGSLRTQRRSGSAFILSGDPTNQKTAYKYEPYIMSVSSRSGHTSSLHNSMVYIIGGRDRNTLETIPLERSMVIDCPAGNPAMFSLSGIISHLRSLQGDGMKPRKHHTAVVSSDGMVVVHGGWTFDGKTRDPVGELFALTVAAGGGHRWFYLGDTGVNRAGHVCVVVPQGGVMIQGGEGLKGSIHGSLYRLNNIT